MTSGLPNLEVTEWISGQNAKNAENSQEEHLLRRCVWVPDHPMVPRCDVGDGLVSKGVFEVADLVREILAIDGIWFVS